MEKSQEKMEIQSSEWQVDERGRRFRMIAGVKEYEMEINGIPQSVFFASQKAQAEQRKKEIAEEQHKAFIRAQQRRHCPFMDGMQTDCEREVCALFVDGCALARIKSVRDTQGLRCPINKYHGKCRTDCALYRDGCSLTGLIAESEVNGSDECRKSRPDQTKK